jgi:thiosulfate/3-mercaptopyruvate sulfurtransferase
MNSPAPLGPQWLGLGLMLAALAAVLTIGRASGQPAAATTPADPAWAAAVERGDDHLEPEALARELLAADAGLVVVDLRPAAEFASWHLPGAINLTVPEVCGAAGAAVFARQPRRVVLCSNGAAHPGQAWVELQRQGHRNVWVLDGGLDAFKAQLLTPPSLRPNADAASAAAAAGDYGLLRAFLLGDGVAAAAERWATDPPQLLQPTMVSTSWLANRGDVVVLDTRPSTEFASLHLPGARSLPPSQLRQRHGDRDLLLTDDATLAATFGKLGIGADTPVVVYADRQLHDATFVALALSHLGHTAVAVLEGGIRQWASERRPLTSAQVDGRPVTYTPRPDRVHFGITTDGVAAAMRAGASKLVDVRPPAAFRGDASTEPRAGHIPGARNRPAAHDVVHTANGTWLRPRETLRAELGATLAPTDSIVVSCRTGHSASQTWFVLRHLLGYQQVRWYNGSWTEWSARADLPAATGDR